MGRVGPVQKPLRPGLDALDLQLLTLLEEAGGWPCPPDSPVLSNQMQIV